jgi:uncharacterized protein YfiM (DUF2279 family)
MLEVTRVTGVSFIANADALSTTVDREKFETFANGCRAGNSWCAGRDLITSRKGHFSVSRVRARIVLGGLLSVAGAGAAGETAVEHRSAG